VLLIATSENVGLSKGTYIWKYLLLWCNVMPYALVQIYQHFGENCCLHFLLWNWRHLVPSKCLSVYSRRHDVVLKDDNSDSY